MSGTETIFALSSGAGKAGVAVIRISGPRSGAALAALAGRLPRPREAALRRLRDPASGEALDRGLVLWFPAPASYTGEDVAELHVHGGRASIAASIEALGRIPGCRVALAGEFTRRAFHNGRLDLTQVEGLADLVDAETEAQRRQALHQMSGANGARYDAWRAELIGCLAYFEADIDFADEADVGADVTQGLERRLRGLVDELDQALAAPRIGERLREGLQVAIAGPPNAGKSSLLNALARRDAAIVSERAGTTRDVIEVHLDLAGYPVILADTAGLRATEDEIEREGVARARRRMDAADLVLMVEAADAVLADGLGATSAPVLQVWNKIDRSPAASARGDALPLSAKTGAGLDRLIAVLTAEARARLDLEEPALITRERHRAALTACRDCLERAVAAIGRGPELAAEDLRLAARHLGRITGRIDVEDLLDVIFADFCIGK